METRLRFQSFDGTALEGTFARATGESNRLAILVHGITSSRDEFGLFSGLATHLAAAGVSSIRFDYRCHGKSTLPRESMTLAGIVNDIQAAAETAVAHTSASYLYIVGMSFGGGLSAFWAATTDMGSLFSRYAGTSTRLSGRHPRPTWCNPGRKTIEGRRCSPSQERFR